MISVTLAQGGNPLRFDVSVREAGTETRHKVIADAAAVKRLGGAASPERLIEAAFRFLLDREPKEAILRSFDLMVITRYFPEFERELPRYLSGQP